MLPQLTQNASLSPSVQSVLCQENQSDKTLVPDLSMCQFLQIFFLAPVIDSINFHLIQILFLSNRLDEMTYESF